MRNAMQRRRLAQSPQTLGQSPGQQMQEAGRVRDAECGHLLDEINGLSQKMAGGKRQQHRTENPQHQELFFPGHDHPPIAIERPGGLASIEPTVDGSER